MEAKEKLKQYWRTQLETMCLDDGVDWDLDDPFTFEHFLLTALDDFRVCDSCKYHDGSDNTCEETTGNRQMCIERLLANIDEGEIDV